jgi:hypothetical protein
VFLNSLTTLHSDCKVRKYGQNIQWFPGAITAYPLKPWRHIFRGKSSLLIFDPQYPKKNRIYRRIVLPIDTIII